MVRFVKGDVVVVPFPFSDLSNAKRRPALVVANLRNDDFILCQITSSSIKDDYSVPLNDDDILNGSLNKNSNIRPNRIFTAETSIILYKIGDLRVEILNKVIEKLVKILNQ